MISTRCATCNYGGNSLVKIYNTTRVKQSCNWTFVTTTDIAGQQAFAATRSAYGGDWLTSKCSGDSCRSRQFELRANDTWSPLILLAGQQSEFGSVDNFTSSVCDARLDVIRPKQAITRASPLTRPLIPTHLCPHPQVLDHKRPAHQDGRVTLEWKKHSYTFFVNNVTNAYQLPTKDGVAVDPNPDFQYSAPHLNADLHARVVTMSYKDYVVLYNFSDDTIKRGNVTTSASKANSINTNKITNPIKTNKAKSNEVTDYDRIITTAHERAAAGRAQRVSSWNTFDFGYNHTATGPPSSSTWTLVGFGHVAAAIGVMFSNTNTSVR